LSALGAQVAVAGSFRRRPTRPKQPGPSKGTTTTQLHPARVLEVRIESPPARSQQRTVFGCGLRVPGGSRLV